MSTCRKTWQNAEAELAELFGCKRRPLSGSSNRPDQDSSDSTHPVLHLEAKLMGRSALWTLWDKVYAKCKKRPVVIGIKEKHRHGMIICVHTEDLQTMLEVLDQVAADELREIVKKVDL